LPATRRGGFDQRGGAAIRFHSVKTRSDFWAKKLARILTDTPIRCSPDCVTIGRTACFGHGARLSYQIIR
jgi:hypothetical protein